MRSSHALVALAGLAIVVAGCGSPASPDAGSGGGSAGGGSAMTGGGGGTHGRPDAGLDASIPDCASGELRCSGTCRVINTDVAHCGGCDQACAAGANSVARCTAGGCSLECAPGFANCDGDATNGCEADLSSSAHCGACGAACVANAHSSSTCLAGSCVSSCASGFADCDLDGGNGCEADLSAPASCGMCTNVCGGANATGVCSSGLCGLSCATGFADCDALIANGCEGDLSTVATCGTCGNTCTAGAHATASCGGNGVCATTCDVGFADCDGLGSNGCEADLTQPWSCGSCATVCAVGAACTPSGCSACSLTTAGVLNGNSTVMGTLSNVPGQRRTPPPSCSRVRTLGEDLWRLDVPPASNVILSTGGSLDTSLTVRSLCNDVGTGELACNDDDPSSLDGGVTSRTILRVDGGTVWVAVQEFDTNAKPADGGSYSLSVDVTPQSGNASCAAATALVPGVAITQNSKTGGEPNEDCQSGSSGGQLFYSLVIPPQQRATFSLNALGASPAPHALRLLTSCALASCTSTTGLTATSTVDNRSASPRTALVSVSAASPFAGGDFSLQATLSPLLLAANSQCTAPTPLVVGAPALPAEDNTVGGEPLTTCGNGGKGTTRYYSVVVPARGGVTVTAVSTLNLTLRAVPTTCLATDACLVFADNSASGTESLRLTNAAATPQTMVVAVSPSLTTVTGTFSIVAVDSGALPGNFACDAPTPLTPDVPATGDAVAVGGMPLTSCAPQSAGYVRYYSVVVLPGQTLLATVANATGSANVGVRIMSGCGPTATCLSSGEVSGLQTAEVATVTNLSPSPATYLIAASTNATNPGASATFSVTAHLEAAGPGSVCVLGIPLSSGQTLTNQTWANSGASTVACSVPTGVTKFYAVTVAARETVNVSVSGNGTDLALRSVDSCSATQCLLGANVVVTGPEVVTLSNDSAGPKTFSVEVVSIGGPPVSPWSITVRRAAYTTQSIPAACDDFRLTPSTGGPIGDDVTSALTTVPFPLLWFGAPVSHFFLSTNGFARLTDNPLLAPTTPSENVAMPNATEPNGVAAPLWDDVNMAAGSSARWAVIGAAPRRRWVTEWRDVGLYQATTPSHVSDDRLTFQLKVHEGSGVVEFHYCSLVGAGGRVPGDSATIGLESVSGNESVNHSFNTPGRVSTGAGLRFTPL